MKCSNHPLVDSVAYCGQCGRALCADCKRTVSGAVYCEACLAARLRSSTGIPPAFGVPGAPSPGVALALGFIPGVGAIYNGQIMKGFIQVLLFGSLIAISNRVADPLSTIFGFASAAFYFYMVFDSYQTARAKQLGQQPQEWFGLGDFKMTGPVAAGLLIVLGTLFMLDNLGIPVFREASKFWPVLLIVLGILILQKRTSHIVASPQQPPANPPGAGAQDSKTGGGMSL